MLYLCRVPGKEKPDILITHHPQQDGGLLTTHPVVGQIALMAYEAAGARWTQDESTPPHHISQIFFLGLTSGKVWSIARTYIPEYMHYVNVTDVVDRKVKAMDHLKSQRYDGKYARKRIEAVDGWFGTRVNVPYAEVFIPMMPEVHRYLPILPTTLESDKGWTARLGRLEDMTAYRVPYNGERLF